MFIFNECNCFLILSTFSTYFMSLYFPCQIDFLFVLILKNIILDSYCMISLISEMNHQINIKQLISSINYIYAYKFKALTDKNIKIFIILTLMNVSIYNSENQSTFIQQFKNIS